MPAACKPVFAVSLFLCFCLYMFFFFFFSPVLSSLGYLSLLDTHGHDHVILAIRRIVAWSLARAGAACPCNHFSQRQPALRLPRIEYLVHSVVLLPRPSSCLQMLLQIASACMIQNLGLSMGSELFLNIQGSGGSHQHLQ